MGLHSRNKGKRAEREVVALAVDPQARKCDVTIAGRPAQVKVSGNGFKAVYAALQDVDVAFLRADRKPWLAVLPADQLFALLSRSDSEALV